MNGKPSEHSVVVKSIAVTRRLAMTQRVGAKDTIGPEFLAAGILKAMPNAGEFLRNQGLAYVIPCLENIPDVSEADMKDLPPAKLDADLEGLMKGELQGFLDGSIVAADALGKLLAVPGIVERLASFGNRRLVKEAPEIDKRELMARVTGLFQHGYRLALAYYSPDSKIGMSDFAADHPPQAFIYAVNEYRKRRDAVRSIMYSGPRKQRLSVFERYMRLYGPVAADVATAVVVNELTPYVKDGALITVRDIAYAIAPYDYHRMAGNVIEAVQTLKKDALVRLIPEPDYCQMFSGVLPTEALFSDFTQYLGGSADW
jgi:hypothetical protein